MTTTATATPTSSTPKKARNPAKTGTAKPPKAGGYYIVIDGAKSQTMSKDDAMSGAQDAWDEDRKSSVAVFEANGKLVKRFGEGPSGSVVADKVKKEPKAKAPKAKKERGPNMMDEVVKALKRESGATTKYLAELTGWDNAGWNTILAKLATSRGLKLTKKQRAAEGSKRQINVWHLS